MKSIKVFTGLSLFLILLNTGEIVQANTLDVKEELIQMARVREAGTANRDQNTYVFVPSDDYQFYAATRPDHQIHTFAPAIVGQNRLSHYKLIDSWGELSTTPMETSGTPLYAGRNVFSNSTSTEQVIRTPEFSYAYTESITSAMTHGLLLGVRTSATVSFPIASGTMEASAEYTFDKTTMDTKTTEVKYTSSAQTINIPANKTYKITAYLNTGKVSGNVNLYAEVDGVAWMTSAAYPRGGGVNVGGTLRDIQYNNWGEFPNFTSNGGRHVIAKGAGKFTSDYGTDFIVKIEDISHSRLPRDEASGPVVQEIIVPLIRNTQ